MANPDLPSVDTTPSSDRPPAHFVETALKALPKIMNPHAAHRSGQPDGTRDIEFVKLRKGLEVDGHARDAAEWAIHEHVLAKRLEAIPGPAQGFPGVVWAQLPLITNGPRLHRSPSQPFIDHRMYEGSTEPRFSQEKERCFIRWTEALRVWWHEINSHRDGNVEREPAIPIERTETEALEEAVRFVVPRLRALAMKGSATVTWAKLDTMVRFELHSQTPTRAVALSLEGLGLLEPIFSPPRNSDRPGASILNIITAGSPSQWRMLPKLLTTQPCEELPSPAENPSAEVPELVDDLSLLRNEVIALHDPGTSRKANGDTVSKIIATPGLTERIAGYGKGTDRASLARFLQSCLQPKKKPGDRPA